MFKPWPLFLLLATLAGAPGGCKDPSSRTAATASASASASAAPSAPSPRPEPKPTIGTPTGPCRAIGVVGTVLLGEHAVVRGQPLEGNTWLELSAKSKLDVKHAASGREYTLTGPGLALPCHGGREQVLLANGKIVTSVGAGARPGALVVIATPLGVVRYGEASLSVEVDARHVRVRVQTGAAWLEAAPGSRLVGKARLVGPTAEARFLLTQPKLSPQKLVEACEQQATRAKRQAEDLLTHSTAPHLGERAKAHMHQRSAAREACLMAEAAARLAPEPSEREALRARIGEANQNWHELPLPSLDQQK